MALNFVNQSLSSFFFPRWTSVGGVDLVTSLSRTHAFSHSDQVVVIGLWTKQAACRHHVSKHILQPCVTSSRTITHLWSRALGHVTSLYLPGLVQSSLLELTSQSKEEKKYFRCFLRNSWTKQKNAMCGVTQPQTDGRTGQRKEGKRNNINVSWEEVGHFGNRPPRTSILRTKLSLKVFHIVFYNFN